MAGEARFFDNSKALEKTEKVAFFYIYGSVQQFLNSVRILYSVRVLYPVRVLDPVRFRSPQSVFFTDRILARLSEHKVRSYVQLNIEKRKFRCCLLLVLG